MSVDKHDAQEVLRHKYGVERARLEAPADGVYAKPIAPAVNGPRGYRFRGAAAAPPADPSHRSSQPIPEDRRGR